MAAQTGRLIQDQKFNIHVNGATALGKAGFTEQKKVGRAGGRKPLGDLSNSMKPSIEQAGRKKPSIDGSGSLISEKESLSQSSKLLKSKNFTIIDEEGVGSAMVKKFGRTKGTVSKVSQKSQTGNRKALTDISNSRKTPVQEIKSKNSIKPSALARESLHPSAIAEERFLHNHEECIKPQCKDMDMAEFLKIVGHDSDTVTHLGSSLELVPAFVELKSENHLKHLELDEIPEPLTDVQSSWKQQLYTHYGGSPTLCKTPKSIWKDYDIKFKLMETPEH
ncbi:hypothetical protein L6164_037012 [Bauhinia variegata]|uniref:Uncharacterized protein n=1 Tax=Bauhinia variegata TaxID=167791 RepID=A0ACB9KIY2_BAUVA|nr:hypothetical protein L6164_037012 [Bauhinia variegata]